MLGRLTHRRERAVIYTRNQYRALRLAAAGDPAHRLGPYLREHDENAEAYMSTSCRSLHDLRYQQYTA